jgi:hypothetical protein
VEPDHAGVEIPIIEIGGGRSRPARFTLDDTSSAYRMRKYHTAPRITNTTAVAISVVFDICPSNPLRDPRII